MHTRHPLTIVALQNINTLARASMWFCRVQCDTMIVYPHAGSSAVDISLDGVVVACHAGCARVGEIHHRALEVHARALRQRHFKRCMLLDHMGSFAQR